MIFDAHDAPGGMLRYGIPAFRLPHDVLDQEIDVIRALGGEFRMGRRLGTDMTLDDLRRDFDAVFLAIGAQGSRGLECPGEELALPALAFLEAVASGRPSEIGDEVLVLGGGNTAMDASRTAVRLGARRVTVLYRRTRREMPCLMAEVEAAEAEGVTLETLVAPVGLERSASGCAPAHVHAHGARRRRMSRAGPGRCPSRARRSRSRRATVIAAIGQTVDASGLRSSAVQISRRGILVDPATLATNVPGVFAGGDGVSGADLAVRAVAAGKLAAVSIDQYLGGRRVLGDPEMVNVVMGRLGEQELAAFFREVEESPRAAMAERPVAERVKDFGEVELGFAPDAATREAERCMHCGCWKATTCQLRQYSTEYGADPLRFAGARRKFERDSSHPEIVYEPGKCILCGACVAVAAEAGRRPRPGDRRTGIRGDRGRAAQGHARRGAAHRRAARGRHLPDRRVRSEGRGHLRGRSHGRPAGSPRRRPQRDCHSGAPGDMSGTNQKPVASSQ